MQSRTLNIGRAIKSSPQWRTLQSCGPRTRGLLRRRKLRIDGVIYTGKESNMYEEVQRGLVTDADEVRVEYRPPHQDVWSRAAVPLLRHVRGGVDVIARTANVSRRMAKYYRSGRKRPGVDTVRRLMPFLRSEARRILKRRSTSPQGRAIAESFLAAFPAR